MESTQKSQNAHEFLMNTLNKISRLGHLMEVQATNLTAKKVTGKDLSQVEVQTRVINKIKLICSVAKENLDAIELNAQDWLDSGGVLDEDSDSDASPQVVDTTLHKPQNSNKTQVPNGNIPSSLNASVSESDASETSRPLSKSCIYISESDVENNTTVGKQLNAISNEDATIVSPSVSENETNKTKTRIISTRQQELSVENGEESATIGDEKSRSDSEKENNSKTTETRDKHLDDNGDLITGVENSTCDSEKTTEDNKKTVNGINTVDDDTEFKPVLKCVDINKLIDSRLKKTSLPDDDVIVIEDESPVKTVIETVGTRSRSDKRVIKNLSTTSDAKQKRYNKKFYMKCAVNVSRCELHLDRLMKKSKIRKLYDGKRSYYYHDKHSVGGAISEKRKSRSVSSKTRSNRACSSDDSFKEFNPRKKKRLENCIEENSSTPLVAAKSNMDKKDDSDSEFETRPPQLDTEGISDLFDVLKSGSKKKSKDSNEDSAKSKKKTDIEKKVTGKSKNNEKATSRDGSPIPKNSKSKKTAEHSSRDSSPTAKESGEENSKSREQSDKLKAKHKSSHRTSKEERESRRNIQNDAKQDLLNSTNSDSNNENAMVTTHLKESRKKLRKTRSERDKKSKLRSSESEKKNKSDSDTLKDDRQSKMSAESEDLNENIENSESGKGKMKNKKTDRSNSNNSENEKNSETKHKKELNNKTKKKRHSSSSNVSENEKNSETKGVEESKKKRDSGDSNATENEDRSVSEIEENSDTRVGTENELKKKTKKKKDSGNSNISENEENVENEGDKEHKKKSDGSSRNDSENENPENEGNISVTENDENIQTKSKKELKKNTKSKKGRCDDGNISETEENSEKKHEKELKKKSDSSNTNVSENEDNSDRNGSENENTVEETKTKRKLKKTKKKRDSDKSNVSEIEENSETKVGSSASENEDNVLSKSIQKLRKKTKKKRESDNSNVSENEENVETASKQELKKKTKPKRDSGGDSNVSENEDNSETKADSIVSENEDNVDTISKQDLKKKTKSKRVSGGETNVSENEVNSETKADSIVSENEDNVDTISKQDIKKKTKSKRDSGGESNVSENEDNSETKADSIVSENEDNVDTISKQDLKKKTKSKRDSGDGNVSENEDNSQSKEDEVRKKKTKKKRNSSNSSVSSLDARTSLNASPSGSGVDETSSKMAEKSSKKEMGRKKNSHKNKTDKNKDLSDSDNNDREIDRLTDLKSLKSHKRHRSQTSNSDTEPNGIENHDDNSKSSKSSSRKSKKKVRKVSENNIDDHPNSDDSDKQNNLDDSDKRNNSDLDDIPISDLASKVGLNAKIVEELLASSDDEVVQNSESDCDNKKKKDKTTKNKDTAETSGSKNGNTEDKSGDSLDDAKSRGKWRKDKLLTDKLSETDTSDEERLIKKMKEKCKDVDDTFTDTPIVKKKLKTTRRRVLGSDSDAENKSNNSDDEDKNSNKSDSDQNVDDMDDDKSKNSDSDSEKKTKKRKAKKKRSSSDNSDDSSASEKKKKRKRIKRIKDSDESSDDDKDSPSKGRKNIRKVMKDESLEYATKRAAKEEQERKKRLEERQRLYNEMFDVEKADSAMKLDKLVLDFDPETKEEFVTVHKKLVKKLKPHQASGVKFMWNACFESLKQVKKTKGSGCILAHCMGLGKTLQVVTLIHTLITNHEKTGVRCVLVCCPLSTVLNWVNEFHIWLKNINDGEDISVFELSKFKNNYERVYQIKEWQDCGGVLVLGYDMFRNLCSEKGGRYKKKQRETLQMCLVDPGPDLVVCDEGHLLKNEKTSISQAMTKIKTLRRIVMTGTPVQNNLKEYYCMVQFVKPNLLGKYTEYMNRFVNPITNGQYTDSTDRDISIMKKRSHVLHKMLDGCVQRQDYGVLAPFLPPKHEYVVFISLTEMQINLYSFYLENISRKPQPGGKGTGFLFPDFQNFQRIWTHPLALRANSDKYDKNQAKKREQEESDESEGSLKDFIDDDDDDEDSDAASSSGSGSSSDNAKKKDKSGVNARNTRATRRGTRANPLDKDLEPDVTVKDEVKAENPTEWWMPLCPAEELENLAHSNKLMILFSILKECEAIGDKVLVFSQSLYSLDVIEHFLEKVDDSTQKNEQGEEHLGKHTGSWALGLDYFRLDGSSSCENRAIWCKSFNHASNARARLFLISTRAGGLGINLVAANRVIIFDVSWNPSHDIQSIFRVYRFGQTKPCYIYRFLAMGTMEEKIYERQVTKQAISKRVIDEQQIDRHYKENDLQELYNFEPVMDAPRELPNLPKDRLFAELLKEHESIYKYHEHDSLLENKEEETLDEAERKAAWEEFENEKNRPPPPPNMGTTMTGTSGMLFGLRTDLVLNLVTIMLKKDNPKLNDQIIRNMIPTVVQRMTAGDYSLVTRMHATLQELQASVLGSSSSVYNPFANMNNMMNAPGNIPMMANPGRPMPTWMNQQQQQHQQRQQQLLMQQRYQQQQPQPMAAPAQGMNYTQSVLAMQTANMAPNPLAIAKGKGKPPKRKAPRLLETVDLDSD